MIIELFHAMNVFKPKEKCALVEPYNQFFNIQDHQILNMEYVANRELFHLFAAIQMIGLHNLLVVPL